MDDGVVGRGEAAGQLHRRASIPGPARRPGRSQARSAHRVLQLGMQLAREARVVVGDLEAHAARAAVRQQRQVLARLQPQLRRRPRSARRRPTPRSGCPMPLVPSCSAALSRSAFSSRVASQAGSSSTGCSRPRRRSTPRPRQSGSGPCSAFSNRALLLAEHVRRHVVDRQAHAAGDIHAHRVGNDRVLVWPARRRWAGRSPRARRASARRPPPPAAAARCPSAASRAWSICSAPQVR